MNEARFLVNRRLANFLTMARLYLDQTDNEIRTIYGEQSETVARIGAERKNQYDRRLGYRAMEAIRNSLQHRSLPITSFTYPYDWEGRASSKRLCHRVTASITFEYLRDDARFKPAVLKELEAGGDEKRDVTPFVREYVEGLSSVHERLRQLTSDDVERWMALMLGVICRYEDVVGKVPFVLAVRRDDNGRTIDEVEIFREGIDRLKRLRGGRHLPTKISESFVSSNCST
jgi:hypothetical protein